MSWSIVFLLRCLEFVKKFNLPLMVAGYLLMFVYTMLTLGKISKIQIRVYLSMIGISSIGRGWCNFYCPYRGRENATINVRHDWPISSIRIRQVW